MSEKKKRKRRSYSSWTKEEKAILKKMWEANKHRNEIGEKLGCTGDAAAHMARYLGYKRTPSPLKWGRIRLDFNIITYRHVGLTTKQIAKKLGVLPKRVAGRVSGISRRARAREERATRVRHLHVSQDAAPASDRASKRSCIRCGGKFDSTHPGHRICDPCRRSAEYQEASSLGWVGM